MTFIATATGRFAVILNVSRNFGVFRVGIGSLCATLVAVVTRCRNPHRNVVLGTETYGEVTSRAIFLCILLATCAEVRCVVERGVVVVPTIAICIYNSGKFRPASVGVGSDATTCITTVVIATIIVATIIVAIVARTVVTRAIVARTIVTRTVVTRAVIFAIIFATEVATIVNTSARLTTPLGNHNLVRRGCARLFGLNFNQRSAAFALLVCCVGEQHIVGTAERGLLGCEPLCRARHAPLNIAIHLHKEGAFGAVELLRGEANGQIGVLCCLFGELLARSEAHRQSQRQYVSKFFHRFEITLFLFLFYSATTSPSTCCR